MAVYRREEALRYAETWARRRNSRYLNFDKLGGDCTNFISQCLFAGMDEMNFTPVTGWYYVDGNHRTPSWTGVQQLYSFLIANRAQGPRARVADAAGITPGDVVQLGRAGGGFYHSTLVVAASEGEIYIAAHSMDQWMRPLSDYERDLTRYLHIFGSEENG